MVRTGLGLALIAISASALPQAASRDFESRVDAFIAKAMADQRVPGLSLAVVRQGDPVLIKGYGQANLELGVGATGETVFKIGSVSKQIIASAAVLLVEEGKLSLDDEAGKHLVGIPETWKGVTVRRLLSHTAGLERELPGWSPTERYTSPQILEMARKAAFIGKPGEKYQSSNAGYFTMGLIVEKLSGMPWPEFVHKRLLGPAGMSASRTTTISEIVPNRADGYISEAGGFRNDEPILSVRTSGAFLSSAADMARWEAAIYRTSVLKKESLVVMFEPVPLNNGKSANYGLGWGVGSYDGKALLSHGGSIGGFRSHYARLMNGELAVIVLANSSSAIARAFARGVADLWFKPAPGSIPPPTPSSKTTMCRSGRSRYGVGWVGGFSPSRTCSPIFKRVIMEA